MPRNIKSSNGQKATSKISLSVTPQMHDDIKILADITNGGNVNDLIISLLETVIKKNSAAIHKAITARKTYNTKLSKVRSQIDFDFLAQDSPTGDNLNGGDSDE